MGYSVVPLGGTDVGASCYLIRLNEVQVLVDCGTRVQETNVELLGPQLPDHSEIHAVVVTHAHTDHVGWLPKLVAQGYTGDIHCTSETSDLLRVMLTDSRRQLERLMAIETIASRYTGQKPSPEPYTREDVEHVFRLLRPVGYDTLVPVSPGVTFSLARAGHILDAASVVVEGGGRRVFFTGDF